MGRAEPPNPVAMTTIMRGDILKENETLTRYVNHKLQQFKLHGSPSLHSLRRDPTPYDSGMPRAPASTHGSLSRYNLDQMTASQSAFGLRPSPSSHSILLPLLQPGTPAGQAPPGTPTPSLKSSVSYGNLLHGQQFWQPTPKASFSSLPPSDFLENRWPSQLLSAIDGRPMRPELRMASHLQQAEGLKWINGAWRHRKASTSPRPTI